MKFIRYKFPGPIWQTFGICMRPLTNALQLFTVFQLIKLIRKFTTQSLNM